MFRIARNRRNKKRTKEESESEGTQETPTTSHISTEGEKEALLEGTLNTITNFNFM